MPRPRAGPWYRRGRDMWYWTHGKEQIPLGVRGEDNGAEARRVWESLTITSESVELPCQNVLPPCDQSQTVTNGHKRSHPITVAQAVAAYLAAAGERVRRGRLSPACLVNYRLTGGHLTAAFGSRPLASLTAGDLEDWADRPGWSQSTRSGHLGTVLAVLKANGITLPVRRPPKESRGADTCLTDEQFAAVLANACRGNYKGDLRALLRLLRETGARPGEVAPLTAGDVDWELAQVRREKHKTRRHTGRARLVVFNTAAMAILTAQREKYGGAGLLFRTRTGRAYGASSIVRQCGRISKRCGFRVIAYGLGRHSFCNRALEAGIPDVVVAGLMGHTGTAMIHKHYSHVSQNARVLKAAAEKISGKVG